jgi:hypothetical protein
MAVPSDKDLERYRALLARTAQLRDDRLNSRDKTAWWATAHRMLTEHPPPEQGAGCGKCSEHWPCGAVTGVGQDVDAGALGY